MNKMYLITIYRKNRFKNLINLIKREGSFVCPNGFILKFNSNNEKWVKRIYEFCVVYGVNFSDSKGSWHYKDEIIETPTGIKFRIKGFNPLIFAETFLYDTHFSDFDLNNKIVIQAGGFIGDTALYYASRGAQVYSFEPEINAYNQFLENLKLNPELSKNITVKNYVIGNDEEIDFPIDPQFTGGSSALNHTAKKVIKIKSKSIATILDEFNITDPYLLDLDIKGKEFEVIKDESLEKFNMIRIEYATKIGNVKIGDINLIIEKLKDYGFTKFRIFKHNEGIYDLLDHGTIEAKK
jgi:FkbM family methyltransferase